MFIPKIRTRLRVARANVRAIPTLTLVSVTLGSYPSDPCWREVRVPLFSPVRRERQTLSGPQGSSTTFTPQDVETRSHSVQTCGLLWGTECSPTYKCSRYRWCGIICGWGEERQGRGKSPLTFSTALHDVYRTLLVSLDARCVNIDLHSLGSIRFLLWLHCITSLLFFGTFFGPIWFCVDPSALCHCYSFGNQEREVRHGLVRSPIQFCDEPIALHHCYSFGGQVWEVQYGSVMSQLHHTIVLFWHQEWEVCYSSVMGPPALHPS